MIESQLELERVFVLTPRVLILSFFFFDQVIRILTKFTTPDGPISILFGILSITIGVFIVALFIIRISIAFRRFTPFCFIPLHALFMTLLEKSFALSVTLLPMFGP